MLPNSSDRSCTLYIPVSLNNDVLYHPGDRNWDELVLKYKFELGVCFKSERMVIEPEQLKVPASEFCRNFWSAFDIYEEWDLADARKSHWRNENAVQRAEDEFEKAKANLEAAREIAWQSKLKLEEIEGSISKKANEEFDRRIKESENKFFKKLGKTILKSIPLVKKFVK